MRGKLKKLLSNKNYLIIALGALGLILIFFSSIKLPQTTENQADYRVEAEERLSSMIESIEGAGKTKVMVTLKNNGEQIYKETREVDISGEYRDEVVIVNGQN